MIILRRFSILSSRACGVDDDDGIDERGCFCPNPEAPTEVASAPLAKKKQKQPQFARRH